jgi:TPR repeat protein
MLSVVEGAMYKSLFVAALATASTGCLIGLSDLGNPPSGSLPEKARVATAAEIAANPCTHNDLAGCIAKCQADDPHACNMVGVTFEFDPDGHEDAALASGFYKRACDATYAPGCNNLAWLYLGGHGVPRDKPRAMVLFAFAYESAKQACFTGDASSCFMAGDILYDGRGVDADQHGAVALFQRACTGGDSRGCARATMSE